MKSRYLLLIFLSVSIFLGGGWFYGAQKIRTAVEERIHFHQNHSPAQIQYKDLKIQGFPFFFNIEIQEPSVEISYGKKHPLVFQWKGDLLRFRLLPWNWKELKGHLEGTHSLTLLSHRPLSPFLEVSLKNTILMARLSHRGLLSEGTLQGEDIQVKVRSSPYATHIEQGQLTLYRGTQVSDNKRQAMWGMKLHAHHLHLPVQKPAPLGTTISELIVDGFVLKPSIPLQDWTEFLQVWREEEGALELTRGHISWGPLTLSLNGTLSVDQNLRPMGSLTANMSGFKEAIDALIKNEVMGKKEGKIGKIALSMMATQENKQTPPSVSLPVTAQNGKLTVGPLMFMPLPSTIELIEGTS